MIVNVTWQGDATFEGRSHQGHRLLMDGPPEFGGKNQGPRPMEMLLLGLGGCASFDVVHFLKKARESVTACNVEIRAERSQNVPSVFTTIHLHFEVSGVDLKKKTVERMVRLSAEKYCSASIMMARAGAQVTHSYTIIPSAADPM